MQQQRCDYAIDFKGIFPISLHDLNIKRPRVAGLGEISARPDLATITIGVSITDRTAGSALSENSKRMSELFAVLEAANVAQKDIQTTSLTLQPRWDQRNNQNNPPRIIGYTAQNLLSVRVRKLDDLGAVLDRVTQSGANRIQNISFGIANPKPLLDEARKRAVADAHAKADLYATAAGVTLGEVQSITESGASRPPAYARGQARMEAAMSVPIAEGEVGLSAQISIVFALD